MRPANHDSYHTHGRRLSLIQIMGSEAARLHRFISMPGPEVPTKTSDTPDAFEPPGGVLVWIIVFVETTTFGAGLVAFMANRRDEPAVFAAGRATLQQPLAFTNTLILLTGGWLMARALTSLRNGMTQSAARWILGAIASGLLFLALKSLEYASKLGHGLGLHHDSFYTYYWLLTVFHFMHVAVAILLLFFMWRGIRGGRYSQADHFDVESSGIFWHMCDVIWLLLYPTLYLLG